jgi:tetratricopeptide (TPR) repeat protein
MSSRFSRLELSQAAQPTQTSVSKASSDISLGTPKRTAKDDLRDADEAFRFGQFEPALQLYTRALRDDRGIIAAWVGQVQMLFELGDHRESRLWSDKALEIFRSNGELLGAKARACLRQGDQAAAISASDQAMQSPGSSSMRWQARGDIMLSQRSPRARDCFEKSFAEVNSDWFDRISVARIYLFHRQAAAAMQYAQLAVEMRPDHAYVWLIHGRCHQALGMRDAAMTSFKRCEQLPGCAADARAAQRSLESSSFLGSIWKRMRGSFKP